MLLDLRQVGRGVGLLGESDSQGAVIPYVPLGKRSAKRWMLAVTLLGLALLVGLALWVSSMKLFRGTSSLPAVEIKSLVVLPLENLSGDPSQEYFADGMTDALIGDLAKIRGLQVISRTSAMHYKGANKPLKEIASELKVDAVVEGTVQRSGDRVQVRAQLIQAATDRHLWAETYERDLRDVLALQSEIAQAIVREIQIKLMPAERARLATNTPVNRKAFDDCLQGRFLFWNRRTDENLYRAISFFQSAIKEDPAYAPAYVGLADCYNFLGSVMIGALPPADARQQAEEAARRALEIDSDMAEAHAALGYVKHFNWDWAAAEQEFKLAIELKPNYAFAHERYASFLISKGRTEEAIAEANRAQELDPFSLAISAQRGFILENARRYDEAIEQLHRVIAMDQDNYQAYWYLGPIYAASGRFAEAVESSEKAAALSRTPGALGVLGMCYGFAGRTAKANKILDELLELNRRRYVTPAALATVYVGLGNKDQAFFWLEKAYQERSNYMAYLKVFPFVDSLRSDPRFDDLLRRMGLAS
jgi:TolB-like protein/Tfp pilus assembly protein PilF